METDVKKEIKCFSVRNDRWGANITHLHRADPDSVSSACLTMATAKTAHLFGEVSVSESVLRTSVV